MIFFADCAGPLREFLDERYALLKSITPSTHEQMRISVRRFRKFLKRPPSLEDLDRLTIARFVKWIEAEGWSPVTAIAKRRDLMSLAAFAAEEGLIVRAPAKVPRPRVPDRVPDAWSADEIYLLLAAARSHRRSHIMEATIRVCWDTCCRISAVHDAPVTKFDSRRALVWLYESKKKKETAHSLTPPTLAALAKLPANRKRLCGDCSRKSLRRWLDQILIKAGFPVSRRAKFHKIRRSKYTAVSIKFGRKAAAKHAGHSDESMSKFYDDLSLHPVEPVVDLLSLREELPG